MVFCGNVRCGRVVAYSGCVWLGKLKEEEKKQVIISRKILKYGRPLAKKEDTNGVFVLSRRVHLQIELSRNENQGKGGGGRKTHVPPTARRPHPRLKAPNLYFFHLSLSKFLFIHRKRYITKYNVASSAPTTFQTAHRKSTIDKSSFIRHRLIAHIKVQPRAARLCIALQMISL